MNRRNELDSCKCSLDGVYLIEASAGTGKTYNIQNLAVRLIIEKGLTIDQILIVTFTRMATAELSDRIRKIIRSSYQYLDMRYKGEPIPDDIDFSREEALLENGLQDFSDKEKIKNARDKLQAAMLDFDNNAISTIHGFCQKMLKKNAFESGILFQTDLIDSGQLHEQIMELIRNQWRKICYSPENRKYVGLYRGLLPFDQSFQSGGEDICDDYILHPDNDFHNSAKVAYTGNYVPPSLKDFVSLIEHPEIAFDVEEKQAPEHLAAEIFSLWETISGIDPEMKIPGTDADEPEFSAKLLLDSPVEYGFGWQNIENLASKIDFPGLSETDPQLCGTLKKIVENIFRLRVSALCLIRKNVTDAFVKLKQRNNFQTYDDLQKRMIQALNAEGSTLAETLRNQFKAAIIDEFQDTDQTQYEIFTKIFAPDLSPGQRQKYSLFLVGDPKQAIYAFRGGDIFTYKNAAEAVGENCTRSLSRNFRSADTLIECVNEVFRINENPFADTSIQFEPVKSSGKNPLIFNGVADEVPFHCLGGAGSKHALCEICAEKIFSLLNSGVQTPGDKEHESVPVKPSDIAVLFRYRTDMGFFQQKLQERGIPYVVNQDESIYDTQEARDLEKLLLAIRNPADVKAVTWLMQTQLAGDKNCRKLCEAADPSSSGTMDSRSAMSEVQEILTKLNITFKQKGFSVMFREFMEEFQIHKRYPRMTTGAQKYSNLLQLRDLLIEKEMQGSKTPGLLLLWLQKQISPSTRTDLESGVILPTDAPAVRIMTIHNSKGLQFPIVFLPDLASNKLKMERALKYHDPERNNRIFHRITDGENSALAFMESLQEELRIAYVALTRASRANYLPVSKKLEGAAAWLFEPQGKNEQQKNIMEKYAECQKKNTLPEKILQWMDDPEATDDEQSASAGTTSPETDLSRCHWSNTVTPVPTPKISYSSAHKFYRRNERRSKSDEETSGSIAPEQKHSDTEEVADIFTLPRGDLFGTACHTILEKLDFRKPDNLTGLIQRYLSVVNIGDKAEIAAEMFRKVISAPLPFGDGSTFKLEEISLSDRCSEMDFDFKLDRNFDPVRIGLVLNNYFSDRLEQDQLDKLFALRDLPGDETFYTGSADLIFRYKGKFFIVDWKTDILDGTLESFAPEYLFGEMWQKFYLYQSLLYSSALIRFLSMRLEKTAQEIYDQYFGGTIYLFLRGVDPEVPGRGIYADKPDFKLICDIAEVE